MTDPKEESPGEGSESIPRPPLTVSRKALLSDGNDLRFRALVHNLLAFSARLQDVRAEFGRCIGLSGIQYTILVSVAHLQGDLGTGVKRIADHLSLSGAFVTMETGKLVDAGLVAKRTNPRDRRRVALTVTKKGWDLLSELAPIQRPVNDALFASLDRKSFEQLLGISAELVQGADEALALIDYLTSPAKGRRQS